MISAMKENKAKQMVKRLMQENASLYEMARKGLSDKVIFETQRKWERQPCEISWGVCKGPKVEVCLVTCRYSEEGSVTGAQSVRRKVVGDEIREKIMGPIHQEPFESC